MTSQKAAVIELSVTTLSFPSTEIGETSQPLQVTLSNPGASNLTMTASTSSAMFAVAGGTCGSSLPAQHSCIELISFSPSQVGPNNGTLTIQTATGQYIVTLAGDGSASLTVTAPASYVRSGSNIQLQAVLDQSPTQAVSWSATVGSGTAAASVSINTGGLLTAPTGQAQGATVSVTAVSKLYPTVSGTLSIPIWPALPSLSSASPASLLVGANKVVTLSGSNLDSTTTLTVNGMKIPYTVISPSELQASISIPSWGTGNETIIASVDGSEGGSSNALQIPIQQPAVSFDAAVRFLQQAAWGPIPSEIASVQSLGFSAWIDAQMKNPPYDYTSASGIHYGAYYRETQDPAMALRHRVGLALQEIYVTSNDSTCEASYCGPLWQNLLEADAFGNERQLLKDVTLSPIMGNFLNSNNNLSCNGVPPNQNYAREIMQLMTIGTQMLNPDGSLILDSSGNPIPTYSPQNIIALSSALSGWVQVSASAPQNYLLPMQPYGDWCHDRSSKNILPGVTLSAGQGAVDDTASALDALFQHPNIGPFLSKLLIQHLVKSSPSPAYIGRISAIFANDGTGQRGNLGAVVKAILLDPEARLGDDPTVTDPSSGHLMEPVLYLANVMNIIGGVYTDDQVENIDSTLEQPIFNPANVFSFYLPAHQLADGTSAPEAQLFDNVEFSTAMGLQVNLLNNVVPGTQISLENSPFWNATSADDLIAKINHYLEHGLLSTSDQTVLANFIAANQPATLNSLLPDVLCLTLSSTGYKVIR
jgi:uncharacterized protein (DUF1800 family)